MQAIRENLRMENQLIVDLIYTLLAKVIPLGRPRLYCASHLRNEGRVKL